MLTIIGKENLKENNLLLKIKELRFLINYQRKNFKKCNSKSQKKSLLFALNILF